MEKKFKNPLAIGIYIGIFLAILNQFTFGAIGGFALLPIALPFDLAGLNIFQLVFGCHGEGCWGVMWIVGTIWLILLPALIGYIVMKLKRKR